MKKRVLACILALALGASLCGCIPKATTSASSAAKTTGTSQTSDNFNKEGLPIVKEPVTITIAAITAKNKNFKELPYFQAIEQSTNVNVQWNMSAREGWGEKKSLIFAGSDLPDAFYGSDVLTDVEIVKYASQGMLIPLNDLIEKYAPNFMKLLESDPSIRAQITAPDGNIYALPNYTALNPVTYSKFFLNKTWLDKLGLQVPETLDEFEQVLKAFKDNDMNGNGDKTDEIPFTFRSQDLRQQNLSPMFGSFGQIDDYDHFMVKDGKVVYTAITEPYKEALTYFNKLYSEGLLDKEGFTHAQNVYVSKIQDPNKIVGGFLGWSRNSTAGANKDDFVAVAPLKGKDGKQVWKLSTSKITSKGAFAITKNAKNPEIIMRWIDQSYEPENALQLNQGPFGKALEKTDDGKYKYLTVPKGMLLADIIHDYGPGVDGVFGVPKETADKVVLNANLQERADLDAFYAPYNEPAEDEYPSVLFDLNEVERISVLQTDIDSYVSQKYASWVSNGGIDQEWDAYLQKLKAMGVDEYIQLHQQAYERYMKTVNAK